MNESTSENSPTPKRSRAMRILGLATASVAGLVLVVSAVSALMGDYKPRAIAQDAVAMGARVRGSLAEDCKDATTPLAQRSVERARKQLQQSRYIADSKLQLASNGEATLEVVMNEVRWSAPWRFWVAAIPAGSTI